MATKEKARGKPIWIKTTSKSRFDRAVTAFIRRYLRSSIADSPTLTHEALGEREGIARQRFGRLLEAFDLGDFYHAYKQIRRCGAPPEPGGDVDTTIKCPLCGTMLAIHNSVAMLLHEKIRYSANCKNCQITFSYSIAPLEPSNVPEKSVPIEPLEPKNEPACAHVWLENGDESERPGWWACQRCPMEKEILTADDVVFDVPGALVPDLNPERPAKPLRVGDSVMVYSDPLGREKPEGKALVQKIVNVTSNGPLRTYFCIVQFEGDSEDPVERQIILHSLEEGAKS